MDYEWRCLHRCSIGSDCIYWLMEDSVAVSYSILCSPSEPQLGITDSNSVMISEQWPMSVTALVCSVFRSHTVYGMCSLLTLGLIVYVW